MHTAVTFMPLPMQGLAQKRVVERIWSRPLRIQKPLKVVFIFRPVADPAFKFNIYSETFQVMLKNLRMLFLPYMHQYRPMSGAWGQEVMYRVRIAARKR